MIMVVRVVSKTKKKPSWMRALFQRKFLYIYWRLKLNETCVIKNIDDHNNYFLLCIGFFLLQSLFRSWISLTHNIGLYRKVYLYPRLINIWKHYLFNQLYLCRYTHIYKQTRNITLRTEHRCRHCYDIKIVSIGAEVLFIS